MLKTKYLSHANRSIFLLLICALVFNRTDLLAAEGKVLEWSEMSTLDTHQLAVSQFESKGNLFRPSVSESVFENALRDGSNKIRKEFKIPKEIKTSVAFWLRIYTQFSTKQVVIYDGNHMDIIYDVIDLRPIAETSKSQLLYEIRSNNKTQSVMSKYRAAFARLGTLEKKFGKKRLAKMKLNAEERNIYEKVKLIKHKHPFKDLAQSLKGIRGQRDNMMEGLLAAETYIPKMSQIFTQLGVPPELTRLSLVESSFSLHALSRVGAAGVWQFMPSSGKHYLMIDDHSEIDERLSPLKATIAAAKMLKWNYKYLGSWALAIISYNHGLRHLPKVHGFENNFSKIAKLFESCSKSKGSLGWASRNYYSEFLAAVYAEAYRHEFYGDLPSTLVQPVAFKQVKANQTALSVAMENGVGLHEFMNLNADIRNVHKSLPRGFWVALPGLGDDINGLVNPKKSHKAKTRISKRHKT